jgi:hypothetical protein
MTDSRSSVPRGENLRRAIRWLDERQPLTPALVAEAGLRFDLTPQQQEFLHRWLAEPGGGHGDID